MKTVILVLLSLLIFAKAPVNPPTDPLEEGLVAYYSFNDCDARDESGNGSHGEQYGNVRCWCGIEDDGLLFDGEGAYLQFPGPVNRYFSTSDFTISFYFKTEGYSIFPLSLLSKRENCEEYHMLDLLLDLPSAQVGTFVHETPTKFYPGISPPLAETGWIHFALVREGFHASTYINGTLQQQGFRCSGVDITNEAMLSFGNSPCIQTGRARRFKGVIDELRVYDRPLTEEEIRTLYLRNPIENATMDCLL